MKTEQQLTAARLVYQDLMSDEEIAAHCKISRMTLARWKKQADFMELVEKQGARRAAGAEKAASDAGFDTVARLIELAKTPTKETNGTITGQVKACLGVAAIRGEIVQKHADVTERRTPEERKQAVLGVLGAAAQRIERPC